MNIQTTMRNNRRSFEVYEDGRLVAMFASKRSAERFASGQPITKWATHEEDRATSAKAIETWLSIQVRPMADAIREPAPAPAMIEIRERDAAKANVYAAMDAREQARGGRLTF